MRIKFRTLLPAGLRAFLSRLGVIRWIVEKLTTAGWYFPAWYGVRGRTKLLPDSTWFVEFGDMKFHLPIRERGVVDEVLGSRVYEQVYGLCEGDIVIDVGAHVGIFSIMAAKAIGENGLVIAIEPEPKNQAFLEENIKSNGVDKVVKMIRGAAGDGEGRRHLYLSRFPRCHSFHNASQVGEAMSESIEVTVDSLDNIVPKLGLERVNFVKIDTEGWELEVLNGMRAILDLPEVKMAIAAYHTLPDGRSQASEILSLLQSKGVKEVKYDGRFIYART